MRLGNAQMTDVTGSGFIGTVRWGSTTTFVVEANDIAVTYLRGVSISATVPMTWTTSDELSFEATYEPA
jgi:hypothetical protein